MPSKLNVKYIDYSLEKSTAQFWGTLLTAANFDAQVGLQDNLISAVDGITLGTLNQYTRIAAMVDGSSTPPASAFAQREMKWLVQYVDDNTGKVHTLDIPTADLQFLVAGTDLLDLASTEGAAFVTAFEAYVVAPDTGNSVTITQVQFVGRNL